MHRFLITSKTLRSSFLLFPVPCSLFPVPFLDQSYVYISNKNAIAATKFSGQRYCNPDLNKSVPSNRISC
ncbi:MAG: hypothetical protein F6K56_26505 [Moorea sp. SIO3G5]|nr:hypothetical protein [Moorena sp. SIO3G5]